MSKIDTYGFDYDVIIIFIINISIINNISNNTH